MTGRIAQVVQTLIKRYNSNPKKTDAQPSSEDLPDPAFLVGHALGNERQGFGASNNFWAFQKTGHSKWGFDVIYESGSFDEEDSINTEIVDEILTKKISLEAEFDKKFEKVFPMEERFQTPNHQRFAKEMTANMLGGVGYFHGKSLVAPLSEDSDDWLGRGIKEVNGVAQSIETGENQLLTATPCRPSFPRGFYWDEGFHLQLIGEWDNDLR